MLQLLLLAALALCGESRPEPPSPPPAIPPGPARPPAGTLTLSPCPQGAAPSWISTGCSGWSAAPRLARTPGPTRWVLPPSHGPARGSAGPGPRAQPAPSLAPSPDLPPVLLRRQLAPHLRGLPHPEELGHDRRPLRQQVSTARALLPLHTPPCPQNPCPGQILPVPTRSAAALAALWGSSGQELGGARPGASWPWCDPPGSARARSERDPGLTEPWGRPLPSVTSITVWWPASTTSTPTRAASRSSASARSSSTPTGTATTRPRGNARGRGTRGEPGRPLGGSL